MRVYSAGSIAREKQRLEAAARSSHKQSDAALSVAEGRLRHTLDLRPAAYAAPTDKLAPDDPDGAPDL